MRWNTHSTPTSPSRWLLLNKRSNGRQIACKAPLCGTLLISHVCVCVSYCRWCLRYRDSICTLVTVRISILRVFVSMRWWPSTRMRRNLCNTHGILPTAQHSSNEWIPLGLWPSRVGSRPLDNCIRVRIFVPARKCGESDHQNGLWLCVLNDSEPSKMPIHSCVPVRGTNTIAWAHTRTASNKIYNYKRKEKNGILALKVGLMDCWLRATLHWLLSRALRPWGLRLRTLHPIQHGLCRIQMSLIARNLVYATAEYCDVYFSIYSCNLLLIMN